LKILISLIDPAPKDGYFVVPRHDDWPGGFTSAELNNTTLRVSNEKNEHIAIEGKDFATTKAFLLFILVIIIT
jgi:hypothetical protein